MKLLKKIISTAIVATLGVSTTNVHANDDQKIALGILGGIILGSAMNNRYVVSNTGVVTHTTVVPNVFGGVAQVQNHYYSMPPQVHYRPAPPVFTAPVATLSQCNLSVHNPYTGRSEVVVVNCYR